MFTFVYTLKSAARPLRRHKPGTEKNWWTPNLTRLRNQSIDIHRLWGIEGKPRQGPTHLERMRVRAAYRKALKDAQRAPKLASWNRLHTAMASNDTDSFWKSWRTLYAKNKSHLSPVVDGVSSKPAIAEAFRLSFEKNAKPNNPSKVEEVNLKFAEEYQNLTDTHEENCNCDTYSFTIDNILDATFSLKNGKSSDDDDISAEHFLNAPYNIFVVLCALFNAMLRHSFVPRQFKHGTIIPIVKDHQGNLGDVGNYRGITISPIASKFF